MYAGLRKHRKMNRTNKRNKQENKQGGGPTAEARDGGGGFATRLVDTNCNGGDSAFRECSNEIYSRDDDDLECF